MMLDERCLATLSLRIVLASALSSLVSYPLSNLGYFQNALPYYTCGVSNVMQCQQLCTYQSICISFSYEGKSRTCELLRDSGKDMSAMPDTMYAVPPPRTDQVMASGCDVIEVCVRHGNQGCKCFPFLTIDCGPPPVVNGSDVTVSTTTYSSAATYACREGFEYIGGSSVSTCHSNSSWSSVGINCTIRDCEWPPYQDGAMVHFVETTFGSMAVYDCVKGFTPSGNGTSVCSASGNWSDTTLECTASYSSAWSHVATTSLSATPNKEKTELVSRLKVQCKPEVKIRLVTSTATKFVSINTYGERSGEIWAHSVKSLSKSSWDEFESNPKRHFNMYLTNNKQTLMTVADDGVVIPKSFDLEYGWFVNTDQCVSQPYDSTNVAALVNALLTGGCASYEEVFYIDDNNATVASQVLGEVSQGTTTFLSNPYWYSTKRTSTGDTFFQRWYLRGSYRKATKGSNSAPWCADICWHHVFNSLTSTSEKQINIRHLMEGVRQGRNLLVKVGNILSSAKDIYLYDGHVTISVAEYWIPENASAFSSDSRKAWLMASTEGVVKRCIFVPESSSVDFIEEQQMTSVWFMDSRMWINFLTVNGTGSSLSGSVSDLADALQEGRSLRVGISFTNEVYKSLSIDNVEITNDGHIAAEAIHRVNIVLGSDSSYYFTSTCQLMSSIITTQGNCNIYTYDLGNGGTHTTAIDVKRIDWFVGM